MSDLDYDAKVALAERQQSFDAYAEVLQHVRKEKLRVPHVVAKYGKTLVQNYSWRLGSDIWTIYEQVFIAALDLHDNDLSTLCLNALKKQFPKSSRVARLEGMELEQRGDFAQAEAIYDDVLAENPANALVQKRKIAALKAQRKTSDVVVALNEFLRSYQTDKAAWVELAETYLSIGAYRYAAFCYEELVLLNPMDAIFHSRLADVYTTLGGLDHLRIARKHYSHSLDLNKHQNVRAYMGLLACTKAIAAHRSTKADADDAILNDRVHQFALVYLTTHYKQHAPTEIADAAATAFKSF